MNYWIAEKYKNGLRSVEREWQHQVNIDITDLATEHSIVGQMRSERRENGPDRFGMTDDTTLVTFFKIRQL